MIDEKKLIEDIINTPSKVMNEIPYEKTMFDNIHKRQNEILDVINRQPRVSEWIPCSERLPEDTKTKIITLSDGSVEGGYYSEKNWWCVGDSINLEVVKTENVIAWMLLPPAYKEVSRDEL